MSVLIPTSGGGGASDYLEYAWVCAPNAAGQTIAENTITTLTINTEIADTGNYGSIAANQITLAAGTYYYYMHTRCRYGNAPFSAIFSLYNISDATYVNRRSGIMGYPLEHSIDNEGQFTITSTKVFELRLLVTESSICGDYYGDPFTISTAVADQRTTIKLWKLA